MKDWDYQTAGDQGLVGCERWQSVRRESGLVEWLIQKTSWRVMLGYLSLMHKLHVQGKENLPQELPFVIVSNHSSHLDTLILSAAMNRHLSGEVNPVAAADVFFKNRVSSAFFSSTLNLLPISRKCGARRALLGLRERLKSRDAGYIIFPEGTRSRNGQLGSFKPGIGMLVADSDIPVIPCYIRGAFESLPAGAMLPKRNPLSVVVGAPKTFSAVSNDREGWKYISDELRLAVQDLRPD
jgi:1-acyl-sn-glycerol-3-phosphate acyltransferase